MSVDFTASAAPSSLTDRVTLFLEEPLRAAVARLDEPVLEMARYHFGWDAGPGVPAGTRRRGAAMTLLCSGSDPERDWTKATDAAVAATVLLNAFVIHDDIIDQDLMRRGRLACWVVYGTSAAIEVGAALQGLAFELIAENPWAAAATAAAARCSRVIAAGQAQDLRLEGLGEVTLADSLGMYRFKDGGCAELCCLLGAIARGGSPEEVAAAGELGVRAGLVFALSAVLGEVWGGPDQDAKQSCSDLCRRKKTPLIAAAYDRLGPAERAELTACLGEYRDGDDDTRLLELLTASGARNQVAELIDTYTREAKELLPTAVPDPRAQEVVCAYLESFRE